MRNPSIHIDKKTFLALIKKFGIEDTDRFFNEARKYSLDNRSVTVTNDKLMKITEKVTQSNKGDTSMMADILYSVRIKLKHRGVKKITQNDRDWLQVKNLSKLANQFSKEFELPKREGYIEYVQLGLSKISSMRSYISKLISMYETICREYEYKEELRNDTNIQGTLEMHNLFVNKIADRTGIYERLDNIPEKMRSFILARQLCDNLGVDYETFIDAQFAALDFCNGIPTPEQLSTDKARERLNKYLFTHNISVEPKNKKDFWNKLKQK